MMTNTFNFEQETSACFGNDYFDVYQQEVIKKLKLCSFGYIHGIY